MQVSIRKKQESIASMVYSDLKEKGLAREEDKEICMQDIRYHLQYLDEAVKNSSPALFNDYVLWADILLSNLGLPEECLKGSLQSIRNAILTLDPESAEPASEYIEESLKILEMEHLSESCITEQPLKELAEKYLELVLSTEAGKARELILSSLDSGVKVHDIYHYVFEPVQHEIGRLWQINHISVAHEHYCTSVTQMIMSELYPYIYRASERKDLKLLATCVNNELHEIGIRMVSDFFEMNGWDSVYLGSNTPPNDITGMVSETEPEVLAISATMTFNIGHVKEIIDKVRELDPEPAVMVGGYPFNIDTSLWKKVGADMHAVNASGAVKVAEEFLEVG